MQSRFGGAAQNLWNGIDVRSYILGVGHLTDVFIKTFDGTSCEFDRRSRVSPSPVMPIGQLLAEKRVRQKRKEKRRWRRTNLWSVTPSSNCLRYVEC